MKNYSPNDSVANVTNTSQFNNAPITGEELAEFVYGEAVISDRATEDNQD